MEIIFENKAVGAYREVFRQIKRIQESAESVVPDTNDDIGRIASVQTAVLLKSKEVTAHGVSVTGEVCATLLYITENESAVSFVRVTKGFSMEYDIGETESDITAQIALSVTNTEARVLNPRKVSVTIELAGELSCYRQETVTVETLLPEEGCEGLHAKFESAEAVIANAVCEKTFALNEQLSFPAGKPSPSQLVSQRADFCIGETQHVGSKTIIKGSVELEVCYLSGEVAYPVLANFSTPFSQIIDTGEDEMDGCTAMIEMTSAYYELIETINGEKALDAELHAVVQLVSRRKRQVSYISDVYSNLMPAMCSVQSSQLSLVSGMQQIRLSCDERISIAEECADVLCVFSSVTQQSISDGRAFATVALDIIYRTRNDTLSSARRLINLEGDGIDAPARIISARLDGANLKPDGAEIDVRVSVEISCQSCSVMELARVESVMLDEEAAYDRAAFPTVTLVRTDGETLWELAKRYHSSLDCIAAMNGEDSGGGLLLIPKEI